MEILPAMPPKRAATRATASPRIKQASCRESLETQPMPCTECGKMVTDRGVRYKGICQWWYHLDCLPLMEEQSTVLNDPENGPWKCDKCLTISSTLTELLETARNLGTRVHTLEATNTELAGRMLDLLVNHEPESAQGPVPDMDSNDPLVETETEEVNSATIESAHSKYEQEHQHQQKQTHEMRKQRQQKRQQQHQQQQQQSVDPSNSMGDRRMVTVYAHSFNSRSQANYISF